MMYLLSRRYLTDIMFPMFTSLISHIPHGSRASDQCYPASPLVVFSVLFLSIKSYSMKFDLAIYHYFSVMIENILRVFIK